MTETYYTVLGVRSTATTAEIKTAYHDLIKQVHPDAVPNASPYWKKQAEERAKEIIEAYTVLSNSDKRRLYDQQIDAYHRSHARPSPSTPNRPTASHREPTGAGPTPATSQTRQQSQSTPNTQQQSQTPPSTAAPTSQRQAPAPVPTAPKPKSKAAKIIGITIVVWMSLVVLGNLISYFQRNTTLTVDVSRKALVPPGLLVRWRGSVGSSSATLLTFLSEDGTLPSGNVIYEGVEEKLRIEIQNGGLVTLRGTSYRRPNGNQPFYLDTFVGRLSPDGMTLQGTYSDTSGTRGQWQFRRETVSSSLGQQTPIQPTTPNSVGNVTLGILADKVPVSIKDDLSGSSIGEAHGVQWVHALENHGAVFDASTSSRIEYATQIPTEGTLEFWIRVNSAYQYRDGVFTGDMDSAMIFSTDVQGGDVTWPGTTKLFVSKNGDISFWMATNKYNQPPSPATEAQKTGFRFGEWHAIGVSYGSEGQFIMLDGRQGRIADELALKLGILVSPRTVGTYWPNQPDSRGPSSQRWSSFVRNHT